jgi:integrase
VQKRALLNPDFRAQAEYLALCLFGGIRPDEVARMTWQRNVKMDTKEIFLQVGITKTKRERIFGMPENLFAWLEFCQHVTPLVPATNIQNMRVRLCKPLTFPWIADGLRHTFATFHYAKHKSFEQLRHVMGNSPRIIDRFYKGAISHTAVDKFWIITPASLTKSE